jgi:alkanesulfonate monooxygenase SsuD/methylene tetrahydromethanopterin reductase-like flavin-dependent oxidoreductase (luciferase family)
LILGLGNGTRRMMEDWHGVAGSAPAVRMEELVEVLRKLWRLDHGPVEHEGRFYRIKLAPIVPMEPPLRDRLPIYLAGVNPRMVEVAGRVGDGVIAHPMATTQYIADIMRPAIALGADRRERDPANVETVAMVMCSLHPDRSIARRELATAIAGYAASRVYDAVAELHGGSRRSRRSAPPWGAATWARWPAR